MKVGKVGWPGESHWQLDPAVEDSPVLGVPQIGGLPHVVPEGTLLNMVLRRMHLPRSCSYQLLLEHRRPNHIQGLRWQVCSESSLSTRWDLSPAPRYDTPPSPAPSGADWGWLGSPQPLAGACTEARNCRRNMKVGWPGESHWQLDPAVEDSPVLGVPQIGGLPHVVPEGTLLNMVLRRMHLPRSCSYQLLLEHRRPNHIQGLRWPHSDTQRQEGRMGNVLCRCQGTEHLLFHAKSFLCSIERRRRSSLVPVPTQGQFSWEPQHTQALGQQKGDLGVLISSAQTPLANSEESLDFSESLEQVSTERVLRAGRDLHRHLLATCPTLIRDRKYHLRLYRQCCSGRELVDGILALGLGVHSRSQAVGICQVLLDEGALCHVKHDWTFQDRDAQFYRFLGPEPQPVGPHELEEELVEAMALLSQRGPDALLTVALRKLPGQRTDEELDLVFEELLHIKAVAHLSNSVKRELAAVLVFEPHSKAGTVLFSQGDKGTSWYIIWKGSVNVVTHGKGLVTTLHEGDDFGQLALVNDAPRAATIILREDNCHFLRVDKQDFNRIIKDVEAKTMRLEEHGKVVLVLERTSQGAGPSRLPSPGRNRYKVMSGTPEKILELLLEAMRPDSTAHDPTETFLSDFLLTHSVFMPTAQLCTALLHQYPPSPGQHGARLLGSGGILLFLASDSAGGSELERSTYICNRRQQILRLVSQWMALYGPMLHKDPVATSFLQARDTPVWLPCQDEPLPSSNCAIRVGDKVPYDICRPDHSVLTLYLPVTASVREVMAALAQEDGWTKGQVLVKVNSAGDATGLQPDARGVATSLGLNERLFVVNQQEVHKLTPHPEQLGPTVGSAEGLDMISAKDLAGQLTDQDWSLFNSIHQVELIHYVLGPQHLRDVTTANLERFMRRFNQLQYWVATELCLCSVAGLRAQLLRKFIKLAAHLKEQKNLNSFFAVMFGLSNSAISRLAHTWEQWQLMAFPSQRLPHKVRKLYSALERLLDPSWNHRVYRLALAKLSPPIIPFMPLLLKDMTFIHEGNHTLVENLINFEKMRMMARTARLLHHCRSHSTGSEQSLSTRSPASTWAYVQPLKVIDNQRELSRLSRELEP
ncbi:Rap guanine nucleotide exchange factor 3 [Heterocephalus glaber]|uniref:Rap guanine nucleotide exchange factor 3 n=1 Tax=Heterocephalus glaber TaxID=10181 RepID=G5BWD0_HETGA|nr:Rap guanine nucleotide exchange factor 3 [Heterocephalus glaber]